jgi:hypothetical protein
MAIQFQRFSKVLAKSLKIDEDVLLASFCLSDREDISQVSDLRRRVFGKIIKEDDEAYLQWRYFSRKNFPSTLWVLRYQGKVIAALGTEPVDFYCDGQTRPAIRSMDAIVEPEYDNRGIGAWMTMAIQSRNDCVLVTGGNENSTSMLKKLFTSLPVRQNYKIILHSADFLRQKSNFFLNPVIASIIDLGVAVYLPIKWRLNDAPGELEIKYFRGINDLISRIDDPINALGQVKVVRSKAYLKWRYAQNPCTRYHAIGVFHDEGLQAYVIFNCEQILERKGLCMGQIVDYYLKDLEGAHGVLTAALIAAVQELKKLNADEVSMVLNDDCSRQAAKAAGFIHRGVESCFFVHCDEAPKDSQVYSAEDWFQSLGDSDTV